MHVAILSFNEAECPLAGYAKDREFREIFLVTHRLFTKSEKVLRLLVYFFKNADPIQMEGRTSTSVRMK